MQHTGNSGTQWNVRRHCDKVSNLFLSLLTRQSLSLCNQNLVYLFRDAIPSARYILMKGYNNEGFTFFTNYESRKAVELAENPNVALTFYWLPLRKSVRVEGVAEKISKEESIEYFHQRPRASQIGALASPQSQVIPSRGFLDKIEADIKEKLGPDGEVPIPSSVSF
jgi:pyridoxamine 5'-phosphate oxidase